MSESKKVLTATDRATKGLVKATGELSKIAEQLNVFTTSAEALAIDIEFKQSELDGISAKTKVAEREAVAELSLRVKENEDKVLDGLLRTRNLAKVTVVDVNASTAELERALSSNQDAIDSAVNQASSLLHARYKGEQSALKGTHEVAVAQKDADLGAKEMQIGFMSKQIASLEATIEAERKARVDIANSEAQKQGITVNTSAK